MPTLQKKDLSRNQILDNLPTGETQRIFPLLDHVDLKLGEVVYRTGDAMSHVYFPLDAVISLVAVMENGRSVEVGLKGCEAVLGIDAVLGMPTSMNVAVTQIPGSCLKIKAQAIQAEFQRCTLLHGRLLRYIRYFLTQVKQTAACNRVHRLEQRFARWLLMVHDRVRREEFPITHEFLSYMLGAPRTDVSLAAAALREAGLIRYERKKIAILDRKRLEAASCECYAIVHAEAMRGLVQTL
jgi:CRP-like cAMP-binding protein